MHFAVYNKLDVPVFIDWKNSSFIMDDIPKQYWEDRTNTNSRTSGGAASYHGYTSYASKSSGSMVHVDRINLIPPKSKIIKEYPETLCKSEKPSQKDKIKHFRNYIAYSTNEDVKDDKFVDNDFQVIEVKAISPSKIKNYKSDKLFYTEH